MTNVARWLVMGLLVSCGGSSPSTSFDASGLDARGTTPDAQIFGAEDCLDVQVHCVDDVAGPTQEYTTIQTAVDVAAAGHTVLVFDGSYNGFRVDASGTPTAPITIVAQGVVNLTGSAVGTGNLVRLQNASYVVIDGFRIVRSGSPMPYDYDNSVMAARGATVDAPMLGLVVRNNEIAGGSPGGFYCSQCSGMLLEANYIHDNVEHTQGGGGHGVYLSNAGTDDVVVRNNRFEDNQGPGLHLNGDSSVGGDGLQTGHLFDSNIIVGNGINGINMDGVQSTTFVNNVIANNGRHGARGYQIDSAAGPANLVFINNTFVQNGDTPFKASEDSGGHVLFNNLIIQNGTNSFDIAQSTPQVDSNLTAISAAGFLVDAAGRDFRLQSGTAAINAGTPSFATHNAPSVDLDDNPRNQTPDVGALEYVP